MCRGFQQNERELLKMKAFYTHLSSIFSRSNNKTTLLPDYLTLHFPPRINGTLLQINGSNIRPDSPGFVTLHRILSNDVSRGFSYGSRERVVVCEGARFEIYVGDVKVLKGIFRKGEGQNWKMDCKCVLSANDVVVEGIVKAEVSVSADGPVVMNEKVEMVAERRRRARCCQLDEIPEEREGEFGSDVCWCSECGGGVEDMDGGDCEMEMVQMEGVRWALDVGVWAVCFGVGYLVCRASSKRLTRRKRLI